MNRCRCEAGSNHEGTTAGALAPLDKVKWLSSLAHISDIGAGGALPLLIVLSSLLLDVDARHCSCWHAKLLRQLAAPTARIHSSFILIILSIAQ